MAIVVMRVGVEGDEFVAAVVAILAEDAGGITLGAYNITRLQTGVHKTGCFWNQFEVDCVAKFVLFFVELQVVVQLTLLQTSTIDVLARDLDVVADLLIFQIVFASELKVDHGTDVNGVSVKIRTSGCGW